MKRKILEVLVLLAMFATLPSTAFLASAQGIHTPSFTHVLTDTTYCSGEGMVTFWGQNVLFLVTDDDGIGNLFTDGTVEFEILAPDGETYPKVGDEVTIFVESSSTPPHVRIAWHNTLSYPPVLGSYVIKVTDADGLSATYVTQPTLRVATTIPNIIYPEKFSEIIETVPVFKWERYSMFTSVYMLEVLSGPETEWNTGIPVMHPRQQFYEYEYDGSLLSQGSTYGLFLFASEDEIVGEIGEGGVETRRVTSIASIQFTIYNPIALRNELQNLLGNALNLGPSDCRVNPRNPDYWIGIRDEIVTELEYALGILEDPTPTIENYQVIMRRMCLARGYLHAILPASHLLITHADAIVRNLVNIISTH